jgi:hypothetical protein
MSKVGLLIQYAVHAIVCSYGVMILADIVQQLVDLPLGSQNRWLDYFFIGPTFLVPILFALALGVVFGASLPKLSSRLLFIFPLAMMSWELWVWIHEPEMTVHRLVDNFVGTSCTSSECLEEALLTMPLVSSFAYSCRDGESEDFSLGKGSSP